MVGFLRVKRELFVFEGCIFILGKTIGGGCLGLWRCEAEYPAFRAAFDGNGLASPPEFGQPNAPSPLTPSAREVMNLAKLEHITLFPFLRLLLMFSVQTSNSSSFAITAFCNAAG